MSSITQKEKESFLADLHVGVLSLIDGSNGPLTVPIWYDYKPGKDLWFITGPNSRKGKLLKIGVRLSLVSQSEVPPYKYVSIEGPVISIEKTNTEDLTSMAVRYLGLIDGKLYVDNNETSEAITVRVKPEHWLAVDYSKSN